MGMTPGDLIGCVCCFLACCAPVFTVAVLLIVRGVRWSSRDWWVVFISLSIPVLTVVLFVALFVFGILAYANRIH